MITKQDIVENADLWLLGMYIVSMPLPGRYGNLIGIPIVLYWIVAKKYKLSIEIIKESNIIKLFIGLFVIVFLSIVTSKNFDLQFSRIEKYLPLLFAPVIFCSYTISSEKLNKLLLLFVGSCSLCVVYSLITTFIAYDLTLQDVLTDETMLSYYSWVLPETLNLKSNYYSLYIGFCLVIISENIFDKKKPTRQIILALLFCFLFAFLGLLSSRTSFLAVALLFIFYLLKLIFQSKFKFSRIVFGLVLIGLVALSLQMPFLRSKIFGILEYGTQSDQRYILFQCGWRVFSENFFFGAGIFDVEELAINCYKTFNAKEAIENQYNFHNVFLQLGASTGVFGLLVFIVLLVIIIIKAIKTKRLTHIGFVVLFFLACLTESLLTRSKGMIFFTTFSTLLFIQKPHEENTSY